MKPLSYRPSKTCLDCKYCKNLPRENLRAFERYGCGKYDFEFDECCESIYICDEWEAAL